MTLAPIRAAPGDCVLVPVAMRVSGLLRADGHPVRMVPGSWSLEVVVATTTDGHVVLSLAPLSGPRRGPTQHPVGGSLVIPASTLRIAELEAALRSRGDDQFSSPDVARAFVGQHRRSM